MRFSGMLMILWPPKIKIVDLLVGPNEMLYCNFSNRPIHMYS